MVYAEKAIGNDGRLWIKVWFPRYVKELHQTMGTVRGAIYSSVSKLWAVPIIYRDDFEQKMGNYLINWVDEDPPSNGGIDESIIPSHPIVPGYSVEYDSDGNIIHSTGFKTTPWGEPRDVKKLSPDCHRDMAICRGQNR